MAGLERLMYRLFRKGELPFFKPTGRSTTIGAETFKVLLKDDADHILMATGTTVPTDGGAGFAKGCLFIDTDVAAGSQGVYVNVGTNALCNFDVAGTVSAGSVDTADLVDAAVTFAKMQALTTGSIMIGVANVAAALDVKTSGRIIVGSGTTAASVAVSGDATLAANGALTIANAAVTPAKMYETGIQYAEVALTKTNILDTGAGGLGHANGFPLVASPGATKVLELISAVLIYDFATAAYDGGGNISIAESGGGKALTGIEAYADSIGSATDEMVRFSPLTTEGVPMVADTGINLICAAAPTDTGGTAAGVVRVKVAYRVHTHGLA